MKGDQARRAEVVEAVAQALATRAASATKSGPIATYHRFPQTRLAAAGRVRWDLRGKVIRRQAPAGTKRVTDLLVASEGVTPGGNLELFLLSRADADGLKIEAALLKPAVKSREMSPWRVFAQDQVLLFPYVVNASGKYERAFAVHNRTVSDALDFDHAPEPWENGRLGTFRGRQQVLERRIASKLVSYPNAARYLVRHYDELNGRVLEKKRFSEHGKLWYEYWRTRGSEVLTSVPRLLSPTLVREPPRFAIDVDGYMSDHAGLYLYAMGRQRTAFTALRTHLEQELGGALPDEDVLLYLLACLNDPSVFTAIRDAAGVTSMGSYPVNKKTLGNVYVSTEPTAAEARLAIAEARRRAGLPQGMHKVPVPSEPLSPLRPLA